MSGRKPKITREALLDVVRRIRTSNNTKIAEKMGVERTSIFYFLKKNPEVKLEVEAIIKGISETKIDAKNMSVGVFRELPIVKEYIDILKVGRVSKQYLKNNLSVIYNVCNHLNVHPENLDVDAVAKIVIDSRDKEDRGEAVKVGLRYHYIRGGIRSWFQQMQGISGERLTSKGIDAGRSKGTGKSARERITQVQRHRIDETMIQACTEYYNAHPEMIKKVSLENLIQEMIGLCHFMYYTATRVGSSVQKGLLQGALSVDMRNSKHRFNEGLWYINLMDKGKRGGIEWDKMLMDDALTKFKDYISKRFDIPLEDIDEKVQMINDNLFPYLYTDYDVERIIMRNALELAGVKTAHQNHIWRHTFAQDFLHASDWNYELTASLGGWKDTGTLKLSYGEMSSDARERGLKRAMGLPVKDVTYLLRW